MIYILGLAGTRSLIQVIQLSLKNNPNEKHYLICRHCFSITVQDKCNCDSNCVFPCISKIKTKKNISHNQQIENENDSELEYYELIDTMRQNGINVLTFTQGSSYGDKLISRYTGIKIGNDANVFETNMYDKHPSEMMKSINNMLVPAFEKRFLEDKNQKQFIIDCFKSTHLRNNYHGCFLHDVKVYFTMCVFDELFDKDIIDEQTLYLKDNEVFDYPVNNYDYSMKECFIKPTRIEDYSDRFNNWLFNKTNEKLIDVDYVVTDPGPGYKNKDEQFYISQDVDDVLTLCLIPNINTICVSDETVVLSRTSFILTHFKDKIRHLEVFENNSVKQVQTICPNYFSEIIDKRNPDLLNKLNALISEKIKLKICIDDIFVLENDFCNND